MTGEWYFRRRDFVASPRDWKCDRHWRNSKSLWRWWPIDTGFYWLSTLITRQQAAKLRRYSAEMCCCYLTTMFSSIEGHHARHMFPVFGKCYWLWWLLFDGSFLTPFFNWRWIDSLLWGTVRMFKMSPLWLTTQEPNATGKEWAWLAVSS